MMIQTPTHCPYAVEVILLIDILESGSLSGTHHYQSASLAARHNVDRRHPAKASYG